MEIKILLLIEKGLMKGLIEVITTLKCDLHLKMLLRIGMKQGF